jgi:hypothetical protein
MEIQRDNLYELSDSWIDLWDMELFFLSSALDD